MTKNLLIYFVVFNSFLCHEGYSQNFDDTFIFAGVSPQVRQENRSQGEFGCLQSVTLGWGRVQNEFYYVESYTLQVLLNNNTWTNLRTVNRNSSGVYSVALNSIDSNWALSFRVRVNVNLEDVNVVTYRQGNSLRVSRCIEGPRRAGWIINKANIIVGNRTFNVARREIPTIFRRVGSRFTEEFTFETETMSFGTDFSEYEVRATFISSCPELGKGCGRRDQIVTRRLRESFFSTPRDVPPGTIRSVRRTIRLKVSEGPVTLTAGTWYIHAGLANGRVVWPIRIEFRSPGDGTSGENCIICPTDSPLPIFSKTSLSEPYQVDIYDFAGQKVLSATVSSKTEENELVADLPKKIYILKTKDGERKVSF